MPTTYMPWQDLGQPQIALHRLLLQVIDGKPVPLPTQSRGQGQFKQAVKASAEKFEIEPCHAVEVDLWDALQVELARLQHRR